MKWEDFNRYLNEGLESNNWRQFHFTMIKLQVHWIASLEQSRWHFWFITVLGLPLTGLCFWFGYMTDFTSQDTPGWPLLSVIMWAAVAIPAKLFPIVYPLHLIVSLITGAFFKEFWECVEKIKSENTTDYS